MNITELRPDHLCQSSNELGSGVNVQLEAFLVDDFTDGIPKG